MLKIITACGTRHTAVPELKAVRGLDGLCKDVQLQLCRLRPVVRVRVGNLGVAQRLSRPVAHRGVVHERAEDGRGGPGSLALTHTHACLPPSPLAPTPLSLWPSLCCCRRRPGEGGGRALDRRPAQRHACPRCGAAQPVAAAAITGLTAGLPSC
eukprot:scaffold72998_cov65-Phaeocystis_antarctica.AAC.8